MTHTELESKHLAELHALAAEAGVERYRMLSRAELVEELAGGESPGAKPQGGDSGSEAPRRRRSRGGGGRERREGKPRERREPKDGEKREPRERPSREPRRRPREAEAEAAPKPEPSIAPATTPGATTPPPARGKRKRRRRWGRRGRKSVRLQDLLLPAVPGRQAVVYAESREDCTDLLRGLAAELADASDGADPIALLIDPSPEELADWRREAPQAEIVAAGQARHADDALAQAARRADDGEDVIVLIDSLSRFAESYADADGAKALFDAGREAGGSGTLTVVAAIERSE